jgi:hypothetical protein
MTPARAAEFPLRHPAVALNTEVERELELALNRVGGRGAQLARRLIKSPKLRRLLRTLAHSRLAVTVMRAWSRRSRAA